MKKLIFLFVIVLFASNFVVSGDGDKIPTATVKKLDGSKINSNTFTNDGKPIIISFWATWCKPCIKEMPGFKELLRKMNRPDVKLLAVSIDQKLYKVQDFVKENPRISIPHRFTPTN